MKSKMLAKLSGCLLFLATGFLILFIPSTGKAQKLDGTMWLEKGSVTVCNSGFHLEFHPNGEVLAGELQTGTQLVPELRYNIITKSWESLPQVQVKPDILLIPGNYTQRTGNKIHLNFPKHSIVAVIDGNKMTGEITLKSNKQASKWEANKIVREANEPKQAKENQPAVPTGTRPTPTGSSTELRLGTYKIIATVSYDFLGTPATHQETYKIKIESVETNGNVKARLYKNGSEGRLKGRVDNGQLELEGFYTFTSIAGSSEYNFKLKATVEDDTLINGKLLDEGTLKIKGTFNIGTLEEDF